MRSLTFSFSFPRFRFRFCGSSATFVAFVSFSSLNSTRYFIQDFVWCLRDIDTSHCKHLPPHLPHFLDLRCHWSLPIWQHSSREILYVSASFNQFPNFLRLITFDRGRIWFRLVSSCFHDIGQSCWWRKLGFIVWWRFYWVPVSCL